MSRDCPYVCRYCEKIVPGPADYPYPHLVCPECQKAGIGMVEIVGADGKIHYRRPVDHKDVREALLTEGVTVRKAAKA